jgi:hypothetical protein
MTPVSIKDSKILDKIFNGMSSGTSKKISNSKTFMALSVERLSDNSYSMAHYFESNGDLVPDPDMEFYRNNNGQWYPVALQLSSGHYTQAIIEFGPSGEPSKYSPSRYRGLKSFLTMWLKNLSAQQGI